MCRIIGWFVVALFPFMHLPLHAMGGDVIDSDGEKKSIIEQKFEEIALLEASLKGLGQALERKNLEIVQIKYGATREARHCSDEDLERIYAKQREVREIELAVAEQRKNFADRTAALGVLIGDFPAVRKRRIATRKTSQG